MYSFIIENKFNLITFPKHGCTQIIKIISELYGYFDIHQHSYDTNFCKKHNNIHTCGSSNSSFDKKLPTYIVSRTIEDKILSYYLSNYRYTWSIKEIEKKYKNNSFSEFVKNLDYFSKDTEHLGLLSKKVSKFEFNEFKLIDLNDFNENFRLILGEYNIKKTFIDSNIINKKQ